MARRSHMITETRGGLEDMDSLESLLGSESMAMPDRVWALFSAGVPCSWCDAVLGLTKGTSHRCVVERWARDRAGRERGF